MSQSDQIQLLRDRAQWYADGCPYLEDREGYQTKDIAADCASDLKQALGIIEALAAARGQQRDQALRNRIAGVASSWGNQDVLDPKEVQRVLTFLLSIELCICGHERAEHVFGEEGTRAARLSRVGQGDWHHFEVEAAARGRSSPHPAIDPAHLSRALETYAEYCGGVHDDECPQDDTCGCSFRWVNDGITEAVTYFKALAALPPDPSQETS